MSAKSVIPASLVSIDVLILLLVMPAHIMGRDAFLVVVMLLAYLLVSLSLPLAEVPDQATLKNRLSFVLRLTCLWVIVTAVVILPTVTNMIERQITPVTDDGFSPANITLSDSALQTELALAYLDEGRNPYVESYAETPLRFYQWADVGDPNWQDPAYEYFVYFPGSLIFSYPVYKLLTTLDFPYDQRLIYLFIYILLILLLPGLVKKPSYGLAVVVAVGLNPLFTEPVILGMNDVAPFLAIVAAIFALQRRRFIWAALFMGIACAIKQYAWFVTPFFLLYVWQQTDMDDRVRQLVLTSGLIGAVIFLVVLPFLIWDFNAFYTDTIAFPAGRAEYLYPIRGFTIGRLLMGAGIIPTFVSPFPFQWLQLLLGLPVLGECYGINRGAG